MKDICLECMKYYLQIGLKEFIYNIIIRFFKLKRLFLFLIIYVDYTHIHMQGGLGPEVS